MLPFAGLIDIELQYAGETILFGRPVCQASVNYCPRKYASKKGTVGFHRENNCNAENHGSHQPNGAG